MAQLAPQIGAAVRHIPGASHLPHALERSQVILLSLGAALLFALGSVLQQRAAARRPRQESMKPSLLLRLAARPLWLTAVVFNVVAYGLQFLALRRGSLLVVQPLLVTALLFALPLGAVLARRRLCVRDWAAAFAVAAGLAVFLVVANPDVGQGEATILGWCTVAGAAAGAIAVLAWAARHTESSRRAAYLGGAAGIVYGLIAVLTKACGTLLDHGVVHALTSWEPYALAGLALGGLMLSQSAFQAGAFETALPLFTVAEPVVAAAVGVFAFHEHVGGSAAARGVEALAVATMVAGIIWLARSPLVVDAGAST